MNKLDAMRWMLCVLVLWCSLSVRAINQDSLFIVNNYTKYEYQIEMRDGVKLWTAVYVPNDTTRSHPILLSRTPYSVAPYGTEKKDYSTTYLQWYKELAKGDYIWVLQDVRGRYMSEGAFTNMTPYIPNKTGKQVDESSDTWDSVDWLVKNIKNNNGKVGVLGISYRGYYATYAGIDAHPAVKCISPQAPMADVWYDDFHHNGAFYLSYLTYYPYFGMVKTGLHKSHWFKPFNLGTPDLYDFGMRLGAVANANGKHYYAGKNVFFNQMIEHPNYDTFWQKRNILPHLKKIKPAVMTMAGLFDAEDQYGSWMTYKTIEKQSPKTDNILVMGPWVHGGWARTKGETLGNIYFGKDISEYYHEHISKPFFDYHLKGGAKHDLPEALVFETGTKQWREFDKWPPKAAQRKRLYLQTGNRLEWSRGKEATVSFNSDPHNPVPYTEAITTRMTREYMTDDQRFAGRRPDVLVFETEPLEEPVTLAGELKAFLEVATTGTDADWIVKIIDVYPDTAKPYPHQPNKPMGGYQRMVRSEVMRGRFRNDSSAPMAFVPNEKTSVHYSLHDALHTFKKGHKIMVQVQSTWFPLIDRNPQQFVPSIYEAKPEDYIPASHTIHLGPSGSFIEVGVLESN